MPTKTETLWFENLTDCVAEYIDDETSEVYAMRPDASYFLRVRDDDGTIFVTQLTNDRAELIGAQIRLTHASESVIAATVEALLA